MALPTQKPRIGFSIESIVGSEKQRLSQTPPQSHPSPSSESSERPLSPLSSSDGSHYPPETLPHLLRGHAALGGGHFQHLPHQQRAYLQSREFLATVGQRFGGRGSSGTPPLELSFRHEPPHSPHQGAGGRMIDLSSNSSRSSPPPAHTRLSPEPETAGRNQHSRSPGGSSSPGAPVQGAPSPHNPKGPLIVPGMVPAGLVRPFPMGHGEQLKSLPPFLGGSGSAAELAAVQAAHNQHNFLAAQYQAAAAAAALAHVQASHGQGGFPGHPGQHHHHHHPHAHPLHNHPANIPRDSYPLYPWLLSRHGRNVFPPRFPGIDPTRQING
uniref:Homeobox domain-containing protein n=1 Tax=Anopheles dirus TaxID=7168 RepID=A0A182NS42_9DIPT